MNILSAQQLKEADTNTLAVQKVSSWQLMERAAAALFENLKADLDIYTSHFTILCGPGNNGGDGLALARMIFSAGGNVQVFLLKSSSYSADNLENQKRLGELPVITFDYHFRLNFPEDTVIIDALYGYGLNRPLDPAWSLVIDQVNNSGRRVLAVDMPSGLLADAVTPPEAPVIKAHRVYTFHSPKKALLLPDNAGVAPDFRVLDIGLAAAPDSPEIYVTADIIKKRIKVPGRFSHKGTLGHALLTGGSYGKAGAILLAARAALKTGCGLVTAYVPQCAYLPLQSAFPEAMVITDSTNDVLTAAPTGLHRFASVGIGPGMGTAPDTEKAFFQLLEDKDLPPLVVDADALNILSRNPGRLQKLPPNTILTPHPGELARLTGPWKDDFEKLEKARQLSRKHALILIIKGAHTAIILPDGRTCFNSTGNYGMATGGSGDVLTGIITSLLAQRYSSEDAAVTGVYLHGLAGDLAIRKIHPKSLIASDIIEHLSSAWSHLFEEAGV